jgi:hypothetical protein
MGYVPTVAARVQARVQLCGICGGRSGTGAGFLRVLRFPLPIFIPPIAPQSPSSIIWGLYNRPEVTAVPRDLVPPHKIKKMGYAEIWFWKLLCCWNITFPHFMKYILCFYWNAIYKLAPHQPHKLLRMSLRSLYMCYGMRTFQSSLFLYYINCWHNSYAVFCIPFP